MRDKVADLFSKQGADPLVVVTTMRQLPGQSLHEYYLAMQRAGRALQWYVTLEEQRGSPAISVSAPRLARYFANGLYEALTRTSLISSPLTDLDSAYQRAKEIERVNMVSCNSNYQNNPPSSFAPLVRHSGHIKFDLPPSEETERSTTQKELSRTWKQDNTPALVKRLAEVEKSLAA